LEGGGFSGDLEWSKRVSQAEKGADGKRKAATDALGNRSKLGYREMELVMGDSGEVRDPHKEKTQKVTSGRGRGNWKPGQFWRGSVAPSLGSRLRKGNHSWTRQTWIVPEKKKGEKQECERRGRKNRKVAVLGEKKIKKKN